jgi:biopolymer transport protein ExbD/biopolymer transport protein TolR
MGASVATGSKKQPEPEINVTPLVDVVLVLLIIFMVIAPALNEGEHVELPNVFTPDPKPKDLNPIEVTMALSGKVVVDKEQIASSELERRLRQLHKEDPERHLLLKADERAPYETVRKTFAMLQDLGFKGVSLRVLERKPAGGA